MLQSHYKSLHGANVFNIVSYGKGLKIRKRMVKLITPNTAM